MAQAFKTSSEDLQQLQDIDEVNMFKDDNIVIHLFGLARRLPAGGGGWNRVVGWVQPVTEDAYFCSQIMSIFGCEECSFHFLYFNEAFGAKLASASS